MDLQSLLGYAFNSPYRNAPYLDIQTPEGLIDMENTPIDLMGIDNLGNVKKMKAGRKNPYKFAGTTVREIPTGNPYQQGGLTGKQAFEFLFAEDEIEEEAKKQQVTTAPSVEEVEQQQEELQQPDNADYDASMNIASQPFGNPYAGRRRSQVMQRGNPYTDAIRSSGQYGNQNVGEFGRQIYGELAYHLGYAPEANSIYRSQAQQNELIAKGVGVKNSYHLTGDAIDLKPADWHRLTNEQQQYYRMRYDVVVHNNHYHIEPKNNYGSSR